MNQSTQQSALVVNKESLRGLLSKDRVTQTLQRVSTRWLSADQLKTQAMIAVARNPKLLNCTQFSFLESVVRAAELGLRFAGAGGEAYLIPYKTKCTLIIGYRGLCAMARRTGKVIRLEARCVHEKDVFKIEYGNSQQLIHRPHLGTDRGEIICCYAISELRGGSVQLEIMTRVQIDQIRKRSRAANDGPWVSDYEEMARKTVLRRLCKYLPFPTAFEDALAAEEPAMTEDRSRKQVEAQDVIPENVDFETGEIVDDANQAGMDFDNEQTEAVPDDEAQVNGPQATDQTGADSLDEQKPKLINLIVTELGKLHPGDGVKAQSESLKTLKYIFGKVQLDEIAKLPVQILEAGLGALKSQKPAAENASGDDIPV